MIQCKHSHFTKEWEDRKKIPFQSKTICISSGIWKSRWHHLGSLGIPTSPALLPAAHVDIFLGQLHSMLGLQYEFYHLILWSWWSDLTAWCLIFTCDENDPTFSNCYKEGTSTWQTLSTVFLSSHLAHCDTIACCPGLAVQYILSMACLLLHTYPFPLYPGPGLRWPDAKHLASTQSLT